MTRSPRTPETGAITSGVAGRHLEHLAGEFAPVGQHVAAEHGHLDALKARRIGGIDRPGRRAGGWL